MTTTYGYSYETARTAKHFTDTPRTVTGITIHHWGSKGQRFDNVVAWFCDADTSAQTSAHYVAQGADADGTPRARVACIVDPDRIAWHAGNWPANVATVGIECRPEARDADYAVVAELVARLWLTYGVVPLYPHKHWTSTACPGAWDLSKLERLARAKLAALKAAPTSPATPPAPPTQGDTMDTALTAALRDAAARVMGFLRQRYYVIGTDGTPRQVTKGTPDARAATALDTLDGNLIVRKLDAIAKDVADLKAKP